MSEALSGREAAALLGVSERTWERLSSQGKTPLPVRLGRSVRWRRQDVMAWLTAGCPSRDIWERAKARGTFETGVLRWEPGPW